MSKSKRLLDLLMCINNKRSFTAKELADEFNVSVRTIQRYLLDLSELGLPIYAQKGKNGGYSVLKNRILPPLLFTEEEAISIFFAYQSLRYYHTLPFKAEIQTALQKFYMNLSDNAKKKVDKMDAHIAFWNPERKLNTPYLKELLEASLSNMTVEFTYDSTKGESIKHVKPIGIYAHNGLWYCPAYCYSRKKILLFRADRILSLTVMKIEMDVSKQITLNEWFQVHDTKNPIPLKVSLTPEGIRQCRGNPWLEEYVKVTDVQSGYIDMFIDEDEINYISSFFYTLGNNCVIIEPKALIDRICKLANDVLNIYR
jgi:predicted DNA-binding transcriptional regulator YafY